MDWKAETYKIIAEATLHAELATPKGRVIAALRRFADTSFPAEREVEAAAAAQELADAGIELLRAFAYDEIATWEGTVERRCFELVTPPPAPTPTSERDRIGNALIAKICDGGAGWSGIETDWCFDSWLQHGERLVRFDPRGATTDSGRTFDRAAERESRRPGSWTNLSSWQRQFEGYDVPGE